MKEKSQEENLDNPTVFKITESEIRMTGITQCKKHHWVKLNDSELKCIKCPTAIIVGVDNIEKYL